MRRAAVVLLLLLASASSAGASSLDRSVLLRVLRRAHPALARCAGKWHLAGRHVVRVDVLDQRVTAVTLREAPEGEPPAARRCITDAFVPLRFPRFTNIDDPSQPARIQIVYPFVIAAH